MIQRCGESLETLSWTHRELEEKYTSLKKENNILKPEYIALEKKYIALEKEHRALEKNNAFLKARLEEAEKRTIKGPEWNSGIPMTADIRNFIGRYHKIAKTRFVDLKEFKEWIVKIGEQFMTLLDDFKRIVENSEKVKNKTIVAVVLKKDSMKLSRNYISIYDECIKFNDSYNEYNRNNIHDFEDHVVYLETQSELLRGSYDMDQKCVSWIEKYRNDTMKNIKDFGESLKESGIIDKKRSLDLLVSESSAV